jgi:hypothetical protein
MKTKDTSVQTTFHPILTAFLFLCDRKYEEKFNGEIIITSGNEPEVRHSRTSLHYAVPGQAADIRSWDIGEYDAHDQFEVLKEAAQEYCNSLQMPLDWIDIVLESTHIHIEFQPKRIDYDH